MLNEPKPNTFLSPIAYRLSLAYKSKLLEKEKSVGEIIFIVETEMGGHQIFCYDENSIFTSIDVTKDEFNLVNKNMKMFELEFKDFL